MTRIGCLLILLLAPLHLQTAGGAAAHAADLGHASASAPAGEDVPERNRIRSARPDESSPFVRAGAGLPTLQALEGPVRTAVTRGGVQASCARRPTSTWFFQSHPFRSGSRSTHVSPVCENLPYDATAPPGLF